MVGIIGVGFIKVWGRVSGVEHSLAPKPQTLHLIEHCFVTIKFLILTWRAYANYAEWLFSLRKRLRGDTFAIFGYSTDYADYAVDLAYTTLYMKHTNWG